MVVLVIIALLLFVWNRRRGRRRYVPHDDVFGEGLTASPVATITPFMDVRAPHLGLRQSEDIQPDMAEISRNRVASRSKETGREVEEMSSDENTDDTGGDATSSLQVHVEQQLQPHRHRLHLQNDLEAAVVGEYARELGRKESAPVALEATFTSVGAQAARSDLDDDIERIGDRIAFHHQDSGLRAPVEKGLEVVEFPPAYSSL